MGRERDKVEKVCRNRSEVGVNVGGCEMRFNSSVYQAGAYTINMLDHE